MHGVRAALTAKLGVLKLALHELLILARVIISGFALNAPQTDNVFGKFRFGHDEFYIIFESSAFIPPLAG